jgi:hypothetical protein
MMSIDNEAKRLIDPITGVAWFGVHVFVAMVIGTFLTVIAAGIADALLQDASVVERGGLLNPSVWVPGIVLGILVNRLLNCRARYSACWIWIVGVLWLTGGIWDSVRHYDASSAQGCSVLQEVVNAFFILNARRCEGGESTLAGLFFTMPAINSFSYAVGVALLLRLRKQRSDQR